MDFAKGYVRLGLAFLAGLLFTVVVVILTNYAQEDHTPPREASFEERCWQADGYREYAPDGLLVVCRSNLTRQILPIEGTNEKIIINQLNNEQMRLP